MDILSFILTRKPRNSNFLSISIREIHLTGKLKPSIRITNLVYKPYVVAQAYLKIQDRFSHYYTILAFLPHPSLNCLFLPREAAPVGFLNLDGRELGTDSDGVGKNVADYLFSKSPLTWMSVSPDSLFNSIWVWMRPGNASVLLPDVKNNYNTSWQ